MISDLLDTDVRNPNIVVHASKLNVIPMKSGIEKNHRLGNSSQRSRFAVKNTMHKSNNEMINITHWKKYVNNIGKHAYHSLPNTHYT